jgi:hypothetical protein
MFFSDMIYPGMNRYFKLTKTNGLSYMQLRAKKLMTAQIIDQTGVLDETAHRLFSTENPFHSLPPDCHLRASGRLQHGCGT